MMFQEPESLRLIEEILDSIRSRAKFSESDLATIADVLSDIQDGALRAAVRETEPSRRDAVLDDVIQFALRPQSEPTRVPNALVTAIIDHADERSLCAVMYPLICVILDGGPKTRNRPIGVTDLPRGLRVIFTLSMLEGEVANGGLVQFIDNSKSSKMEYAGVTPEDCRIVAATQKAELLEMAFLLFRDWDQRLEEALRADARPDEFANVKREIGARFWPEFEKLDKAYDALESVEPIFDLAEKYIRTHPGVCLGR